MIVTKPRFTGNHGNFFSSKFVLNLRATCFIFFKDHPSCVTSFEIKSYRPFDFLLKSFLTKMSTRKESLLYFIYNAIINFCLVVSFILDNVLIKKKMAENTAFYESIIFFKMPHEIFYRMHGMYYIFNNPQNEVLLKRKLKNMYFIQTFSTSYFSEL